jgi:hypothetical protein
MHAMKDCKTFLKLQEVAGNKQAEARRQGYEGNTNNTPSANQQANNEEHRGKVNQIKETTMMVGTSHPKGTSP